METIRSGVEIPLAIIVACTPWQMLSYRGGVVETPTLRVDERDPDYRIILNPITDDASQVVGVAGMILDEDHFINEFLPSVIKDALPDFFHAAESEDLVVSVRDGKGRLVLATRDHQGDGEQARARVGGFRISGAPRGPLQPCFDTLPA